MSSARIEHIVTPRIANDIEAIAIYKAKIRMAHDSMDEVARCTLNLPNHPFHIDLMPIELGRFDVIIGMDWLSKYHAVIVCDEKSVWIPYGNEVLTIYEDGSEGVSNSRLSIISYTKKQKYIQSGCHVFLARVTKNKTKDKSGEKRLEDVLTLRDFLEVFPEDLPGLPPTRQVKF
ncbi:putative reverse transcriptase domain-containing protein [Tanacetum coccineum]